MLISTLLRYLFGAGRAKGLWQRKGTNLKSLQWEQEFQADQKLHLTSRGESITFKNCKE